MPVTYLYAVYKVTAMMTIINQILEPVARMISTASDAAFTLTGASVSTFINLVVSSLVAEFTATCSSLHANSEEVLYIVTKIFTNKDCCSVYCTKEMSSDRRALTIIYQKIVELFTTDSKEVADLRLIGKIKNDPRFAQAFFYAKHKMKQVKGNDVSGLMHSITKDIWDSYTVVVTSDEFSTILYEHIFSDGTFSVLDDFRFRSSIFTWLKPVAKRCVVKRLETEGRIPKASSRTLANTELNLGQCSPEYSYSVITDMVPAGPDRDILLAIYYERLSNEEILDRFGLDNAKNQRTNADLYLSKTLLENDHPYNDALVDKHSNKVLVSSTMLDYLGETKETLQRSSPLRDIFGDPDDPEFESNVKDFLYEFTDKLPWSDSDKIIWKGTFIEEKAGESVALMLSGNRNRGYVYTRYNRLKPLFQAAIRRWYKNVTERARKKPAA